MRNVITPIFFSRMSPMFCFDLKVFFFAFFSNETIVEFSDNLETVARQNDDLEMTANRRFKNVPAGSFELPSKDLRFLSIPTPEPSRQQNVARPSNLHDVSTIPLSTDFRRLITRQRHQRTDLQPKMQTALIGDVRGLSISRTPRVC
jgi:hypothetical protein